MGGEPSGERSPVTDKHHDDGPEGPRRGRSARGRFRMPARAATAAARGDHG